MEEVESVGAFVITVVGIDSVNRVVWPEMVEVDSGSSVAGIADDVVAGNCTGVVVC